MQDRRRPDPGGIFQYDDERHVLAHLRDPHDDGGGAHAPGQPMPLAELVNRMQRGGGPYRDYSEQDVFTILEDLEATGDAIRGQDGWAMSDAGFAKLTGPMADEPPPMSEEQVIALQSAGQLTDEQVDQWRERHAT